MSPCSLITMWTTATVLCVLTCQPLAWAQEAPTETNEAPAPPTDPAAIQAALARYAHEPTIESLLDAMRQQPELDPNEMAHLRRRARAAALLPQLRAGARRGQGVDLSERVDDLRYSTDDSLSLELSLTWRLDRLVFGQSEVALAREASRRVAARATLERLLITAYFERRRLQLERDLLGEVDIGREVRIAELGALLNAMTRGAFPT